MIQENDDGRAKLNEFMGQLVTDMGGAAMMANVILGEELGLYRAMAGADPTTPEQLAEQTRCNPRLIREWLSAQAAAGYVEASDGRFRLPEAQAMALANEDSPVYVAGGASVPALDGVVGKLEAGATVADVGCGHGASTVIMAQAFPASTFFGFDFHAPSIDTARERAARSGVGDRATFEVANARGYPAHDYDLICFFDCLHDMGDPVGAARHAHQMLAPDGTVLLVEPFAGDRLEDNANPVGRLFYAASTFVCTPNSLSQEVGLGLGAQAGEARLRDVFTEAGFSRFRRATKLRSTPFSRRGDNYLTRITTERATSGNHTSAN